MLNNVIMAPTSKGPMPGVLMAYLPESEERPCFLDLENMCTDEEKGCSVQDLVKVESCRAESLLSNDINIA